jgi:hypothetical protein
MAQAKSSMKEEVKLSKVPSSLRVCDHRLTRFSYLAVTSSSSFFRFGGLPLLFPIFPGTFDTFFCLSLSLRNSIIKRNVLV